MIIYFIFVNFQHHYSSLQCHMILQKSFQYADFLLKKHLFLFLMLKTVVLLNIFVETAIRYHFDTKFGVRFKNKN